MNSVFSDWSHRCTVTLAVLAIGRAEAVELYGEQACSKVFPIRSILRWLGRAAIVGAAGVAMLASSPLVSAPARPDNGPIVLRHDRWLALEYTTQLGAAGARGDVTSRPQSMRLAIEPTLLHHSLFLIEHDLVGRW